MPILGYFNHCSSIPHQTSWTLWFWDIHVHNVNASPRSAPHRRSLGPCTSHGAWSDQVSHVTWHWAFGSEENWGRPWGRHFSISKDALQSSSSSEKIPSRIMHRYSSLSRCCRLLAECGLGSAGDFLGSSGKGLYSFEHEESNMEIGIDIMRSWGFGQSRKLRLAVSFHSCAQTTWLCIQKAD